MHVVCLFFISLFFCRESEFSLFCVVLVSFCLVWYCDSTCIQKNSRKWKRTTTVIRVRTPLQHTHTHDLYGSFFSRFWLYVFHLMRKMGKSIECISFVSFAYYFKFFFIQSMCGFGRLLRFSSVAYERNFFFRFQTNQLRFVICCSICSLSHFLVAVIFIIHVIFFFVFLLNTMYTPLPPN